MGIYGAVAIYPADHRRIEHPWTFRGLISMLCLSYEPIPATLEATRPRDAHTYDLAATARAALRTFETAGFLPAGVAEVARADRTPTFATCRITERPPPDLDWVCLDVEPRLLSPAISEIVYTQTQAECSAGTGVMDGSPDELALPTLSVSVFSRAVDLTNEFSKGDVAGWAFVEFGFEDCRLSEDIHRIRNPQHRIFSQLAEVFGCEAKWGVVGG
jgi:hypothetical protein